ncbi:putative Glycine-rich domain-containing protein [Helianthus annuus]|nr:glycine-rich domain-containing protein 1 isoform X2 [Helianthus annuus]XP_021983102.1 glycine-rich domain-containing protein 1 isoform X2 [Helianthus annuus]XP_035833547.1 glycine-rich domain-containing protein 1 isoform X2 [Helianthus annuus]XP_035833548.1 glycine-rich domain-containing protein 1 isoform X2 [Helianthus annuus]XP_035833549.1 glycine-rich domain-containing protein 1 isoform X2 [Helianthus annuus]KAF5791506.1 putative Glycine-rich domain-containing protein [Helianthus annuus]
MDMEQESEWNAAQNISISENLLDAAKRQLQFLQVVDRNRWLYQGPALQWAIYRYNACWLPLLAKHSDSPITEGPLVVPLDCEWVWHCHRLNPVRYKSDCEEFYEKILDNCNVASSVQGISKSETEEIWNKLYPDEPYDFDMTRAFSTEAVYKTQSFSKYDFALAIERQSPFYYQVSRPHVKSDLFLEAAVARYKGFLHIIRRNRERSVKRFCVPTYDIDLIWHTHQLHPASYCKDLTELIGKVLEHDDTDQNRAKGQKLDTGFSETTKQWEETFGSRYWRAGAMYRGAAPSPVATAPCIPEITVSNSDSTRGFERLIDGPKTSYIEVLLEFVEIKNLPESNKGKVNVLFSKAQPDGIFNVKRKLTIQSETGQKQVAIFQCQPSGYLLFELVSQSTKAKTIGTCYISMEEFFGPVYKLSVERWLDLAPSSGTVGSELISLRVAASCTLPIPAPHVAQMLQTSRITTRSCFSPLSSMVRFTKSWSLIIDPAGDEIIRLRMRELKRSKSTDKSSTKEIHARTKAGETLVVGQFIGQEWSLLDSVWSLKPENTNNKDSALLLTGPHMVKLVTGRKLDYEPKHVHKQTNERNFMTAIEFSVDHPYGKAVALIDLKTGLLTLQEDWFALAGIVSAFVASKHFHKGRI